MKSISVFKDKSHPNEYESEFDFSEYLTNKKTGRNLNSNSISINDIQNFNKSCNYNIWFFEAIDKIFIMVNKFDKI